MDSIEFPLNAGGSTITTQYGWQWEKRFADNGGDVVGLVEWVALGSGNGEGFVFTFIDHNGRRSRKERFRIRNRSQSLTLGFELCFCDWIQRTFRGLELPRQSFDCTG